VLHGEETWYYQNGRKQWEVNYDNGRKVGVESFWRPDGELEWTWEYRADGTRVWAQWWSAGRKKAESHWRGRVAEGPARRWSRDGKRESDAQFRGSRVDTDGEFNGP
jgi:antitoxin component YwqK of YwqJK toxin-antitoxin module